MKKIDDIYSYDKTALIHSFQEACSNKDFQKYTASLNISEDILINYTSSLLDAFNEKSNCQTCSNIETCPNKIPGYLYTPIKDNNIITFSYVACPKQEKKYKIDAYKSNLNLFDMPLEIKDASFKNIYKDDKARLPIIKYFKEFMTAYEQNTSPKGLYLTGSFGSGKTYLLGALFNELAKKGVQSALIYYPEFLRSLKSSFQTNTYQEQFNFIRKVPLLLLDDIGAENCSNWSRDEVLGPILQYRMENNLPTFFTSNLTLEELEKNLSLTSSGEDKVKARRIIERIKQLTKTLELVSKNRRE